MHDYAKVKQSPSQTDGAESGVSTGVDQSVMPDIHVEAHLYDILPQIWQILWQTQILWLLLIILSGWKKRILHLQTFQMVKHYLEK